jgi:uncharacterized protein (TIGR02145 family)
MAENMRCTHSPSTGTLIVKTETGNNVTYNKFIKVAHWWNNDEASNQKYGLLYNWCAAVDTFYKAGGYGETSTSGGTPSGDWMPTLNEDRQGICPKGWHIPTDSEWGTMLSQVGDKPAGKLSSGCDWYGSSTDKNNRPNSYNDPNRSISGFGAKPAGFFDDNTMDVSGNSSPLTRYAYFWSASPYSPGSGSQIAIIRYLTYNAAQVTRDDDNGDIRNGYSVRCLRNVETLALDVTGDNNISTCTGDPASSSYSATVTFGGDIDNDFTYSWSVSGGATVSSAAGNSCTISYPTVGAYTVTCTATKGTESIEKEISVNFSMGSLPSFTTYEDNLTVTVYSQTNVSSFNWGGTVTSSTSSSCIYASNGIYTITATSGDGCTTQKTVAVGTATLHPCTVSEPHSNYTGGGFNGANDGRETVVEGKITSVTDYDGNEYPVTQIGSQCWLAENMRCEHSPSHDDGVSILNPDNKSGSNASGRKGSQVAQWYNNNSANASKSYGLLYNWCAAVDTFNAVAGATIHTDAGPWWGCNFVGNRRGICPKGWHVPTVEEWNQMESYVNGSTVDHSTTNYVGTLAGELSKGGNWSGTSSLDYPNRPNTYADENRNSSGFGAVPAGYTQYSSGYVFAGAGTSACFWTATKYPTDNTYRYVRKLQNDKEGVKNSYDQQTNQYSVRCVRD